MTRLLAPLLALCACSGAQSRACSPDALEALVRGCEIAIYEAPMERAEAIEYGCHAAVDAWETRCGGGR